VFIHADQYGSTRLLTDSTGTDLYYLRARYYDPTTAQFLSRDPLAALTQRAYGYAGGNPINFSDPVGLWDWGLTSAILRRGPREGHQGNRRGLGHCLGFKALDFAVPGEVLAISDLLGREGEGGGGESELVTAC